MIKTNRNHKLSLEYTILPTHPSFPFYRVASKPTDTPQVPYMHLAGPFCAPTSISSRSYQPGPAPLTRVTFLGSVYFLFLWALDMMHGSESRNDCLTGRNAMPQL